MKYFLLHNDINTIYIKEKYKYDESNRSIDLKLIENIDLFIQELIEALSYNATNNIYVGIVPSYNYNTIYINVENGVNGFRLHNPNSEILSKLVLTMKYVDTRTAGIIRLVNGMSYEAKLKIELR